LSSNFLCEGYYEQSGHNNGMHPTADTTAVINSESLGAAGDAWRWAANFEVCMKSLICACLLLTFCVAPVFPQGAKPTQLYDPLSSKLRAVKWLSSHDRGFGGGHDFYLLSKEFLATRTAKDFKRMVNDRDPIVRAMGLLCLAQADADELHLALVLHTGDKAEVYLHEGCIVSKITVGEFARRLLSNPYFLDPEGKRPAM
jgi:hypothetical protein